MTARIVAEDIQTVVTAGGCELRTVGTAGAAGEESPRGNARRGTGVAAARVPVPC
jgi:hypothetical protein